MRGPWRWPWRRRRRSYVESLTGEWMCPWCGWKQTEHSIEAAIAALYAHQRETCVHRRVRVHGEFADGSSVWGWTHRGCEQWFDTAWSWPDAYDAAVLHARSHDLALSDEESAQLRCAARYGKGLRP